MQVRFYNAFSKRKNSTKKPANTDAHYDVNVVLKEDTTIERPSLVLTNPAASASGNPVTVSSVAGNMINPVVTLNVIQEGSGTPSPSNPRNIGAYGDARIHVNSNTTIIDFGDTVYGGTLDVTTGVLTVKFAGIDLGDYNWLMSGTQFYITSANVPNIKTPSSTSIPVNAYCTTYNVTSRDAAADKCICVAHNGNIVAYNSDYTDRFDFRASMAGTYFVYEMSSYTTIQLTPEQISLAQGTNVVTTNGNSTISFGYLADELATDYVYAYIPKWDKYYFVDTPNIITNNHIQYDLEEDYLATRKTEVGNTVAQIVLSSTGYDIWKVDTRLPVKVTKTITYAEDSAGIFSGLGCYVLGLSNNDAGTSVICYYAMTQTELNSFMSEVTTDTNLKTAVENYCADVWDAIVSCSWMPVSISEVPGTSGVNLKVSNYTCTTTGKKISNPPNRASAVTLSIPWTHADFRRTAPYTTLNAWIPGFGFISLNSSDLTQETSLTFNYMVDCMTGDCCCNILKPSDLNVVYQSISYNMGIAVPLSRYTQNAQAFINNTASFVGNAGTLMASIPTAMFNPGGVLASAVGTVASGANLCLSANSRDVSIKGTLGGRAIIANGVDTAIIVFSMNTEDPNNANYIARWGRPVGKTQAISNHSGFVQCEAASVALAGDNTEREVINNYLNTGFFYE